MKPSRLVLTLKQELSEQLRLPAQSFWLVHRGKPMDDAKMLAEYSVGKRDTLHLHVRMLGGSKNQVAQEPPTPVATAADVQGGGDVQEQDAGAMRNARILVGCCSIFCAVIVCMIVLFCSSELCLHSV